MIWDFGFVDLSTGFSQWLMFNDSKTNENNLQTELMYKQMID